MYGVLIVSFNVKIIFAKETINNDNHIDSNDKIRSLKETVRSAALEGDKIDDIKNKNDKNENDTARFFGTGSKSRSVINNDSTFQLKDAMNKKHEKRGENEKHKNCRQSKKHSSKHNNSENENSENNDNEDDKAPV